jgi:hypothetical protein
MYAATMICENAPSACAGIALTVDLFSSAPSSATPPEANSPDSAVQRGQEMIAGAMEVTVRSMIGTAGSLAAVVVPLMMHIGVADLEPA